MSKRGSAIARRVIHTLTLQSISTSRTGDAKNPVLREYYLKKCESKPKLVAMQWGQFLIKYATWYLQYSGTTKLLKSLLHRSITNNTMLLNATQLHKILNSLNINILKKWYFHQGGSTPLFSHKIKSIFFSFFYWHLLAGLILFCILV